jgi:hypothetical protein
VNADTREEARGDDAHSTFARRIGTRGGRQRRPPDVVQILRGVPSCNLRVFDLAAELLQPDGTLDVDAAARRQPDLHSPRQRHTRGQPGLRPQDRACRRSQLRSTKSASCRGVARG